jgi:hypothetical protein
MDKFHINPETGNPGVCSAKVKCPFGGDEVHYFSKEAAQKAFEEATKEEALKVWKKKTIAAPEPVVPAVSSSSSTNIGHGRGSFHGRVATPAPKPKKAPPASGIGHGGFHGYTTDPWSSGAGRGGHGF